jgi:hypothetical protein
LGQTTLYNIAVVARIPTIESPIAELVASNRAVVITAHVKIGYQGYWESRRQINKMDIIEKKGQCN